MQSERKEIIRLTDIQRYFSSGENKALVLKNINLSISQGEMVAIVGASGSGKSTLMNILGCLDRPSSGSYRVFEKEAASLESDQLSELRRNHFGFIFQRYHLLSELTVLGNTEIPAIYANYPSFLRKKRAQKLLERLNMGERLFYKPNQLSGGQQQRVSIARALMNGADIILADEPTGALDKKSSEEVLRILEELHGEGHTIILVTHDMVVANRANRIIEISDGQILSNTFIRDSIFFPLNQQNKQSFPHETAWIWTKFWHRIFDQFKEALCMAFLAMNAHRMRTFLTMLGIIIGIAAVVSMIALGNGTQEQVLRNFNQIGTNTLTIFAGKNFADVRSTKVTTLVEADLYALAEQPYVAAVTPTVSISSTLQCGSIEANSSIIGVGEQFFKTQGAKLIKGRLFDLTDIKERTLDLVLDKNALSTLFPDGTDPIGRTILAGKTIVRIVGVVEILHGLSSGGVLSAYLPYTSVQTRFLGNTVLRSITLLLSKNIDSRIAEVSTRRFLKMRHGKEDFFIRNSEEFLEQITQSTQVLALLVASIAFISLLVGGIGVMNIMLVAVSERIGEIGIRMAVGARRGDILYQFLIEAIFVCFIGGIVGILLGLSVGSVFKLIDAPFELSYSSISIVGAFLFSSFIGVTFGYLPARNASKLDPILALSR